LAFITRNSNLEPLLDCLFAQIHIDFQSNPNRLYVHLGNWPTDSLVYFTGGNLYCAKPQSFGAQMSAKVDLLFLKGIIAMYWSVEQELIAETNLMTFDLKLINSLICRAGKYLLPSATQCCGVSQSGS